MGCAASVPAVHNDASTLSTPVSDSAYHHPRETRILQLEQVDTYKSIPKHHQSMVSTTIDEDTYKYVARVDGEWRRGLSAGGSRNDVEMFSRNPQYLMIVAPPPAIPTPRLHAPLSASSKEEIGLMTCSPVKQYRAPVLLSLYQNNANKHLHIAFFVYKVEEIPERLEAEYFLCVSPLLKSGVYVDCPTVLRRCSLKPGMYVVVSAAYTPHHAGTFTLKACSDRPVTLQPLQNYALRSAQRI